MLAPAWIYSGGTDANSLSEVVHTIERLTAMATSVARPPSSRDFNVSPSDGAFVSADRRLDLRTLVIAGLGGSMLLKQRLPATA
jgi:hypothetical protein